MGNINDLLTKRLKPGTNPSSKMAEMARQSANGNLTSFSGIFSVSELSEKEKALLESILEKHVKGKENIQSDLRALISLTSEVKAINNQAAILHGERIKKAQTLLKTYQEGAFTAWLLAAYGNRQTPYNLMQYYEFYEGMPKPLRPQIEAMPRQAIYTLASREAPFEEKKRIVENYKGETKLELLILIRELFPLSPKDKRKEVVGENVVESLNKCYINLNKHLSKITKGQKKEIEKLLEKMLNLVSL